MTFRVARGLAVLVIALGAAAAGLRAEVADASDFRGLQAGACSFSAPTTWQTPVVDGPDPAPLEFSGDDWSATLTDRPRQPEAGAMLVLRWSNDIGETGDWPVRIQRVPSMLAGHGASRIDWNDRELQRTGFDLVVAEPGVGGKRFLLSCRSSWADWIVVGALCEQVAATIRFVGNAAAAVPPITPSTPIDTAKPPPAPAPDLAPPSAGPELFDPATWGIVPLIGVGAAGRSPAASDALPVSAQRFCDACGATVQPDWKFCKASGEALKMRAASTPSAGRPSSGGHG